MIKPQFTMAALVLAIATLAFGHAVLVEATPAANATVPGPDIMIQLRFNSRIDAARSRIDLVLPDQSLRMAPLERQSSPATLSSHITGAGSGAYRLRWQVLAADGHITRGEVPFQVK
jgi:methionine-rich copper-binding protein CopC